MILKYYKIFLFFILSTNDLFERNLSCQNNYYKLKSIILFFLEIEFSIFILINQSYNKLLNIKILNKVNEIIYLYKNNNI